jgi:predicted ArsR family transcriptional regulator
MLLTVRLCETSHVIDLPAVAGPDDALSQPTRARLFALLAEQGTPSTTAELADRLGLHPNGVRTHLELLEHADLIARERAQQSRGRPPDAWKLAPGARPGGRTPTAYQDLGRWLARALKARPPGVRGIESSGREIGRELPPAHAATDPDALESVLTELGFQPTVTLHHDDRLHLSLRNCPYRAAVHENQPAICALHRGITRGLLDVLHPQAKLESFVPHDPDTAGCEIELRGLKPPPAAQPIKS